MKRIVLVALVLLGGAMTAQADNSFYTSKTPRSDTELQAAGQYCDQLLGTVKNGAVTSARYKKCMLKQGWRYRNTTRDKTWIDPETGDTCHDILGGLGSSCGNF
jgi:hypothetical protein